MTQCELVCVNTELESSAKKSFPAKNRICWCKYMPCFLNIYLYNQTKVQLPIKTCKWNEFPLGK